jgi:hypothetical protein
MFLQLVHTALLAAKANTTATILARTRRAMAGTGVHANRPSAKDLCFTVGEGSDSS